MSSEGKTEGMPWHFNHCVIVAFKKNWKENVENEMRGNQRK